MMAVRSEELAMASGREKRIHLGEVSLSDQPIEGTSVYGLTGQAPVRQIVVIVSTISST